MASSKWCIILAAVGGMLSCASVNVLAWHSASKTKKQVPAGRMTAFCNVLAAVLNILLGFAGVGFFVLATGFGPVALAMPIQAGSTLLCNMLVQSALRISHYSKDKIVGTLVLVLAVVCLLNVGPTAQPQLDPLKLILKPPAVSWLGILSVLMVAVIGLLPFVVKSPPDSFGKICTFAVLAASSNVLGSSLGKLMQSASGSTLAICLAVYAVLGIVNFGAAGVASATTDTALYLPLSICLQLSLNCVTGLMLWEDWRVIHSWEAYISVYLLILLGVYAITSVDLVFMHSLKYRLNNTKISDGITGKLYAF
jgi:hypothetical protein